MYGSRPQGRHEIEYMSTPNTNEESLPNGTGTLSVNRSKKLMRLEKDFKSSSTSAQGTVGKVAELHPAGSWKSFLALAVNLIWFVDFNLPPRK